MHLSYLIFPESKTFLATFGSSSFFFASAPSASLTIHHHSISPNLPLFSVLNTLCPYSKYGYLCASAYRH